MISGSILDSANQARLDAIEENSKSFQKLLLEQTKKHYKMKREAISKAEDQHRKDKATLKEARQTRKMVSICDVVDKQKDRGQVSRAEHDQMQQILQDVQRQAMDIAMSASSR